MTKECDCLLSGIEALQVVCAAHREMEDWTCGKAGKPRQREVGGPDCTCGGIPESPKTVADLVAGWAKCGNCGSLYSKDGGHAASCGQIVDEPDTSMKIPPNAIKTFSEDYGPEPEQPAQKPHTESIPCATDCGAMMWIQSTDEGEKKAWCPACRCEITANENVDGPAVGSEDVGPEE